MAVLSEEHEVAERRLTAALTEEQRLSDRHEAAVGTAGELAASVELRAATGQVAARNAWLECVDTEQMHIAPRPDRAAAQPATAAEAWLMWVEDDRFTGRDATDIARLRLR
jgi:hypothetical protein